MSFFLVRKKKKKKTKKKLLRRFGGAVAIIDASSSALGKTCWDIEADTSLEFAAHAIAKIAALVKELKVTS
jgi:hypothetical protein